MELRISERAKNYPPSGIRKMFDLATQYPDAIKLTVMPAARTMRPTPASTSCGSP